MNDKKKLLLIKIDYNTHLALPIEQIAAVDEMFFVKEVSESFERLEKELEIQIIPQSKTSAEVVDLGYKRRFEDADAGWSRSIAKAEALEKRVKELEKASLMSATLGPICNS
jgi:hypothetical protein